MGLVLPFLLADAILGWMLLRAWRDQSHWLGARWGGRDERWVWRMSVMRLAGLLALSLLGTWAALRA